MAFIIFLALSLLFHGALGSEIVCEKLAVEKCSYAISSEGRRCLLENNYGDEEKKLECKTSQVKVERIKGYIESEECVKACGVDRYTVGISSDNLLQPNFLSKLCSTYCFQSCPNILHLYFNLALAEGVYLLDMCENPRRALSETKSSGDAAPGSVAVVAAYAPTYEQVKPACPPSTI